MKDKNLKNKDAIIQELMAANKQLESKVEKLKEKKLKMENVNKGLHLKMKGMVKVEKIVISIIFIAISLFLICKF